MNLDATKGNDRKLSTASLPKRKTKS